MKSDTSRRDPPAEPFLPCVWMSAGLVAYKLCTLDYDCDRCPFDAALRGVTLDSDRTNAPRNRRWEFPDDRLYHASHGWIRELGRDRLRFGLDAFAARLIGRPAAPIFPAVQSRMHAGGVACWIDDGVEPIPLTAPVTGSVVRRNERLERSPGLLFDAPYDDGWLLEIHCGDRVEDRSGLLPSAAMRRRTAAQLRQLRLELAGELHGASGVGTTLADGGRRLTDLRQMLGPRRCHRLVVRLLS